MTYSTQKISLSNRVCNTADDKKEMLFCIFIKVQYLSSKNFIMHVDSIRIVHVFV